MRAASRMLIAVIACKIVCGVCSSAQAQAWSGRYLGALTRVETDTTTNSMRHFYDVGTRTVTPGGLDLNLRMNLQYESRPADLQGMSLDEWLNSVASTDILRSRFNGDLRGSSWRVRGQLVPWQRLTSASSVPRRRDVQMGFDWTPRLYPQLKLNITRADRDTELGRSRSEDQRAELSFNRAHFGSNVSVRHLESTPAARSPATAITDEFRAGLRGNTNVRGVLLSGSYDALVTDFESRERRRDQHTQRISATSAWSPNRKLSVGINGFSRWGRVTDNAFFEARDISETSLGAQAGFRPYAGLSFDLAREYRRQKTSSGDIVSDYLRLQSIYRRALVRRVTFQTGYLQSIDLKNERGTVPNSSAFGFLDGELLKGLSGRAELRASRSGTSVDLGTQWRRVVQVRSRPTRTTRFEVLWQRDTLPKIEGEQQRDRTWDLTGSYEPIGGANFVASYRQLDGEGRIDRRERLWSYNASWRTSQRTIMSFQGSNRSGKLATSESSQRTLGADLTFWMSRDLKVQANWRRVSQNSDPVTRSYGLTLTRNF